MPKEIQQSQTTEVLMETKDILSYQNKKVLVKKAPQKGQNVAVYVRPGDEIEYQLDGINIETLEYRLVGGDIVVTLPNGGLFTFVSMALMGYSDNPPGFSGVGGQKFSLGQVLSQVEEVNDLPLNSLPVEADIQREDKVKKIVEDIEETMEKVSQMIVQQEQIEQEQNKSEMESSFDFSQPPVEIPEVVENQFTSDESSSPIVTPGDDAKVEGVLPTLTFDINIEHIRATDEFIGEGSSKTLHVTGEEVLFMPMTILIHLH